MPGCLSYTGTWRTYGEREALYQEAREKGVIFIRYDRIHNPEVTAGEDGLEITVTDPILQMPVTIVSDLLTLAAAVVPEKDEQLAQFFKVPIESEGFFAEAHVKLAPSDFAVDGVFLCGLAHYPKPIDESIAQAKAAASSATTPAGPEIHQHHRHHCLCQSGRVQPVRGLCGYLPPMARRRLLKGAPFAGKAQVNSRYLQRLRALRLLKPVRGPASQGV